VNIIPAAVVTMNSARCQSPLDDSRHSERVSPGQMLLDLVERMPGEVLVDLCDDPRFHVVVEGIAQVGQGARRSGNNRRLHLAFAYQFLERVGDLPGEAMFVDLVPVGLLNGAALVLGIGAREKPSWPIAALIVGRRILIDEHLFRREIGEFLVADVAQKQRLAAVADKHDRVVWNVDFVAHESSTDSSTSCRPIS
jgi:hypothetical protein